MTIYDRLFAVTFLPSPFGFRRLNRSPILCRRREGPQSREFGGGYDCSGLYTEVVSTVTGDRDRGALSIFKAILSLKGYFDFLRLFLEGFENTL